MSRLDSLIASTGTLVMSVAQQRWFVGLMLLAAFIAAAWSVEAPQADPHDAGFPTNSPWLIFGFAAQALFTARMVVQWIASERAKRNVIPPAYWYLSLFGGLALGVYFLRRGDPVGLTGQLFGIFIYVRNIILMDGDKRAALREEPVVAVAEPDVPALRPVDLAGQPVIGKQEPAVLPGA